MAIFQLLFVQANLLHFHLSKLFQKCFVIDTLRFHKWFDVDEWAFKLSFFVDILAFFDLATFWAIF